MSSKQEHYIIYGFNIPYADFFKEAGKSYDNDDDAEDNIYDRIYECEDRGIGHVIVVVDGMCGEYVYVGYCANYAGQYETYNFSIPEVNPVWNDDINTLIEAFGVEELTKSQSPTWHIFQHSS